MQHRQQKGQSDTVLGMADEIGLLSPISAAETRSVLGRVTDNNSIVALCDRLWLMARIFLRQSVLRTLLNAEGREEYL